MPILGLADPGTQRTRVDRRGRMEWVHEVESAPACGRRTARAKRSAWPKGIRGKRPSAPGRSTTRASGRQRRYRALVDNTYAQAQATGPPDSWAEALPELHGSWQMLKEKYGYHEQAEPTPQAESGADGGSWRGKGGRALDADQNAEIDLGYSHIREVGENVIVPGVLRVEAEDPSRRLAGFEHRIKGEDRLKEKVADLLEPPSKLTAAAALSLIVDAVRFTYEYQETRYTNGVPADVERVKAQGFELEKLKNTWDSEQYKGINTQWLEPRSGVRFEVQFHTSASLEAKELTHEAYERIRIITEQTPETERESAEAFQSEVNARVPIPPDVHAIEDYRREKRDG